MIENSVFCILYVRVYQSNNVFDDNCLASVRRAEIAKYHDGKRF